MPLSNYQKLRMRGTVNEELPDLCDVNRPNKTTKNAAGGTTDAPATIASGVPCRAELNMTATREQRERMSGGQVQSAAPWYVRFRWDTVVKLDDMLEVTTNGRAVTLNVTGIQPSPAGLGVFAIQVA